MKKLLAAAFAILLLFSTAAPVGAEDIQPKLEDFVCTTHNIEPEAFIATEFYQVYLEHLDLNLSVLHWLTEESDYRKGLAAWVAETDEFLADDEVIALMEENRRLADIEFQRLQEEAGKMDIGLYRQLLEGSPEDTYQVYISPVYSLTQELTQEIEALYAEYGFEPPQDTRWDCGVQDPVEGEGGGQSGSAGACEPAAPPQTVPMPLPDPDPAPDALVPNDCDPAGDIASPSQPISSDGEPGKDIYQPYPQEFYDALNQLYLQGYAQALSTLTAYLDGIEAVYQVQDGQVIVTLTAAQIRELAFREDVQWISSYIRGGVAEDLPLPQPPYAQGDGVNPALDKSAASSERNALAEVPDTQGKAPWLWSGAFLGLLALGAFLIIKK